MFFYYFISKIYFCLIYLAAPFYSKAKKGIDGRKNFFKNHSKANYKDPFIWFHISSLGEFEQGRPLIEKIKKEYPEKKILISFFSPSGYEIRKNYEGADVVVYLPFDSRKNAKKFIDLFNIELAIFVKYDLWPYYIKTLLAKGIPTYLVSASFRENQFYFKWYGGFLRRMLQKLNAIFVQDLASEKIAIKNGFKNVAVAGDLRIDRVIEIKNKASVPELLNPFLQNESSIIFGSIWPQDEAVIDSFLSMRKDHHPLIIVPHEVGRKYVVYLQQKYSNSILLSEIQHLSNEKILIVDNIGMLNSLYKTACLAYVGGGFGKWIHNVLEPAVFGIPVFFGPKHQKFAEAIEFIENKIGFSSNSKEELAKMMADRLLNLNLTETKAISDNWFQSHSGATELIFNRLKLKCFEG